MSELGHRVATSVYSCARLLFSHRQRRRTNAAVYGVASEEYIFVLHTDYPHDGTVLISRDFDIQLGDMLAGAAVPGVRIGDDGQGQR